MTSGEAPIAGKSPWGAVMFILVSLLGSFTAAGIIAGLNWNRVG